MSKIGLFYGSDTGNTETIVEKIVNIIGEEIVDQHDMATITEINKFSDYENIIIGVSTWYDGELQSDWDYFFEKFKTIDFSGKTVAIFGLGDQYGYGEWFVDGIGILGNEVLKNGGNLVGAWSTEGYNFDESVALFEHEGQDYFMGLALDEDNESELSDERIQIWLNDILEEFGYEVEQNEA